MITIGTRQQEMEVILNIRCDVPKYVHDELAKLHGAKKTNAEKILMDWATRQKKKEERQPRGDCK